MASKNIFKTKNSILLIVILSFIIILTLIFQFNNVAFIGKHSIHEDAKKYSTMHCLAFYPDGDKGKEIAKQVCKGVDNDSIYDYALVPYGDFYLVNYGNGISYFTDKEYNSLVINDVNDESKKIISDYLRYTIKKEQPDRYYNADFLKETNVDNLNFDEVTYKVEGENLICDFSEYNTYVYVPLKHIQKQLGMNFGYPEETYQKPTFIDLSGNHPFICLTFDDGPQFWYEPGTTSTESIVDTLYEYDAVGTFYVVGDCVNESDTWEEFDKYAFLMKSINQGNEYGSHCSTHAHNLVDYETNEIVTKIIDGPNKDLQSLLGYTMKTYRPIGGIFDENVLKAQPLPAILWDIDSEDWDSRDADAIYEQVMKYDTAKKIYDGDVILFHDIYDETAEAIKKLVPALINKGYQLVTVSDMLRALSIDSSTLSYYYSESYYE